MFEQLFVRPRALARHSAEPLPDERRRFLAHLKECGLPRVTLRGHAEMLLRVEGSRDGCNLLSPIVYRQFFSFS